MGKIDKSMGLVLWVGDDPFIVDCGERSLEQLGFAPLTARFGSEALNTFARYQGAIRLVIFDMLSTSENNQSLVEEMMALGSDIKALIITSKPDYRIFKGWLPQEDIVFIKERFTLHTLSRKISRLLNGNRLPDIPVNSFGFQNLGFHSEALAH